MATAGPKQVILETSVLISFLKIDRVDLLARLPDQEFLITDHVRDEITQHYPQQVARLTAALQNSHLREIQVTDQAELVAFAQLASTGLGNGECSAIAAASLRGLPLAIDDKVAVKRARLFHPGICVFNTESLIVSLIHENILDVAAADAIKDDWEQNHRFRLAFESFAERI